MGLAVAESGSFSVLHVKLNQIEAGAEYHNQSINLSDQACMLIHRFAGPSSHFVSLPSGDYHDYMGCRFMSWKDVHMLRRA